MKSDHFILMLFGAPAAALILMFFATDVQPGFLNGGAVEPVPGNVYELTSDNLAAARRHAPVLVALFTERGNLSGARMSRGIGRLAEQVRDRAIVAIGNVDAEPELVGKASLTELPAWVVYRDGTEISRAIGENSDLSLNRMIMESTGAAP